MLEFKLPFKLTPPLDFSVVFKNYFLSSYGNDALYKEFSAFFNECTNMRKELDYGFIGQHLASNPKLFDETEQKIIKFLRYEYLLDKSFVFQTGAKASVNLSFSWVDSFNIKNVVNISNMKYEISGHLYNFALNEYFNSIKLMNSPEPQQKKLAVAKFKVGAWALGEIKAFLPIISSNANNVKPPNDLNRNYITVLENLMLGLAYFCFIDLHEKDEQEFGTLNISTLGNEASKCFKIALEILMNDKDLPLPAELKRQLHSAIYILYSISFTLTCMKLAKHYEILHADDQTKGYLGLNISYFKGGAKAMQTFFQQKYNVDTFPSFLKDRVNVLNSFFGAGNSKNETRNAQIYKQKVYAENELPPLADIHQQIKLEGVKPSLFNKPFEYENLFEVISNPEIQKNTEELRVLFEKRKKELEEEYKKINERKLKAYVDSYVNYLLEKTVSNNPNSLPKTLEDKRKAFLAKGGFTKLSNAVSCLKDNSFNCQMLLEKIKEVLIAERDEDVKMRNSYQKDWNRMTSEQLTQEYWKQLNDLTNKVKIAQGIDGNIGQKFQTYSKFGETISKSPEELLKLMPNQGGADHSSHKDLLQKLQGLNAEVLKSLEALKEVVKSFSDQAAALNYTQEAMNAKKAGVPLNQVFSNYESSYGAKFQSLATAVFTGVDEVCVLATTFNSSQKNPNVSNSDAKVTEDLTMAAVNLCECYDDIDQGLNFYQSLSDLLLKLDSNVRDFSSARDLEKNALVQEITQKMAGMNFQGNFNPYGGGYQY